MRKNPGSKFRFVGVTAVAVLLLVFAACELVPPGDGVGDPLPGENITVNGQPGGRIALAVQGTAPVAPAASVRAIGSRSVTSASLTVTGADGMEQGVITLTDARISLKEFKFKRAEAEAAEEDLEVENEDIKLEGPFVVDLLTDIMTPEMPPVDVVAGTYTEIEVKINVIETDVEDPEYEDVDDNGDPLVDPVTDPMAGYSIYLEGTYTGQLAGGNVENVNFVMAFDLDEEVTIAASDPALGFVVNHDMIQDVIVAFRIAQWFDFSDLEVNSDEFDFNSLDDSAAITLDGTVETDAADGLRDVIKHKIEASADTGKDVDGDGQLDSDEDDDPDEQDVEDGTGPDGEVEEGDDGEG